MLLGHLCIVGRFEGSGEGVMIAMCRVVSSGRVSVDVYSFIRRLRELE